MPKMSRRGWLRLAGGVVATPGLVASYGLLEAECLGLDARDVPVPRLPDAFEGLRVGLLTDPHHGKRNSLAFIARAVGMVERTRPDLILLGGDFVSNGGPYFEAVFDLLSRLEAPLGVYAVPGNHDRRDLHATERVYDRMIVQFPRLQPLTNRGVVLERGGQKLHLAGLDDIWWGKPDLSAALRNVAPDERALLLCHNPDFAEQCRDPRVGLVLSGHMHGGQVRVPLIGSPWLPSQYGDKYRHGLVRGPLTRVFVSAGVGTVGVPFRVGAPPEVHLLTLRRDVGSSEEKP